MLFGGVEVAPIINDPKHMSRVRSLKSSEWLIFLNAAALRLSRDRSRKPFNPLPANPKITSLEHRRHSQLCHPQRPAVLRVRPEHPFALVSVAEPPGFFPEFQTLAPQDSLLRIRRPGLLTFPHHPQ
jgi:hypothetical protein